MNDDLGTDVARRLEQDRIEIGVQRHPAASACSAWARPISPPSGVTAEFSAMFCGLKGATRRPRRASTRASPATSVLLPASEVVPWTIKVAALVMK